MIPSLVWAADHTGIGRHASVNLGIWLILSAAYMGWAAGGHPMPGLGHRVVNPIVSRSVIYLFM